MTTARAGPVAREQSGELDRAASVAALARLVRRADGFLFAPVEIALAATADRFAGDLAAALAPARLAVVTLDRGDHDLLRSLADASGHDVGAVLAHGLGHLLDGAEEPGELIRTLNFNREDLRDRIGAPLVLTAPRRTLALLERRAPDLWAWRATLLDWAADPADVAAEVADLSPDWGSAAADKRVAAARAPIAVALADGAGTAGTVKAEAAYKAGLAAWHVGDLAGAAEHLDAALSGYRATGDRLGEAHARLRLAELAVRTGDLGAAAEHLDAALGGYRATGDRQGEAAARRWLAELALHAGDPGGGAERGRDTLAAGHKPAEGAAS